MGEKEQVGNAIECEVCNLIMKLLETLVKKNATEVRISVNVGLHVRKNTCRDAQKFKCLLGHFAVSFDS